MLSDKKIIEFFDYIITITIRRKKQKAANDNKPYVGELYDNEREELQDFLDLYDK
jgi:hypothetical protein